MSRSLPRVGADELVSNRDAGSVARAGRLGVTLAGSLAPTARRPSPEAADRALGWAGSLSVLDAVNLARGDSLESWGMTNAVIERITRAS